MKAIWKTPSVIAQTEIIARSLKHWTERDLLPGKFSETELAEKIFPAPFVLVSHGTEADPVLNYGNAAALALWEMSWAELTRTPSRRTASLTIMPASAFPKTASGFASGTPPFGICFRQMVNSTARQPNLTNGNTFEFGASPANGTASKKI
jgi:hypothetical protein